MAHRRAPAALAVSGLVVAEIVAVRVLFRADRATVWFLGEPFGLSCAFNEHFHVPCPACGVTRGVVLALHGDISAAWAVFPAAPLLLLGLVALVLGLWTFAAYEHLGARRPRAARWLRAGGLAYIAVVVLVWAAGYGARLSEVSRLGRGCDRGNDLCAAESGARLTLASEDQRHELFQMRRRENQEVRFVDPSLSYTLSESDLLAASVVTGREPAAPGIVDRPAAG